MCNCLVVSKTQLAVILIPVTIFKEMKHTLEENEMNAVLQKQLLEN
jgi:hypothetical protein